MTRGAKFEVAREVARIVAADVQHHLFDRQRRAVEQRHGERHSAIAEVLGGGGADVMAKQVRDVRGDSPASWARRATDTWS
jgi:hypothetical protein